MTKVIDEFAEKIIAATKGGSGADDDNDNTNNTNTDSNDNSAKTNFVSRYLAHCKDQGRKFNTDPCGPVRNQALQNERVVPVHVSNAIVLCVVRLNHILPLTCPIQSRSRATSN